MERRKRILIVEDVKTTLNSYMMMLGKEFKIDSAYNLADAKDLIDKCTYHAALVDIMLAGNDATNRDGVFILEYLRDLNEGTKSIVLTTIDKGKPVRDFIMNFKATDYINKEQLIEEGMSIVKSKLKEIIETNPLQEPVKWDTLVKHLAFDMGEANFVSLCLEKLKIKGGFENLSHSLVEACKYLMPLLKQKNIANSFELDSKSSALRGKFWSKGQCKAVEIILCNDSIISKEIVTDSSKIIWENSKKGLKIIICELPNSDRGDYTYITKKKN